MKQILALLLTAFTLSFAACTKSDNSSMISPPQFFDVAYFKGDMNDGQILLYSFNGHTVNMSYKGMQFTGVATSDNGFTFQLSVSNGLSAATGTMYVTPYYAGIHTPTYIIFTPGSIFESRRYTLIN